MDRHPQLPRAGQQHSQLQPCQFNSPVYPVQVSRAGASASPRLLFPIGCPGLGNCRSGAVPRLAVLGARRRPSFGIAQWALPRTSPGTSGDPQGAAVPSLGGQGSTRGCCDGAGEGLGGGRGPGGSQGFIPSPAPGVPTRLSRFWVVQPRFPQQSPGKPGYIPGQPLSPWVLHNSCTKGVTALLVPHFSQSPGVAGTPWAGIWLRPGVSPPSP